MKTKHLIGAGYLPPRAGAIFGELVITRTDHSGKQYQRRYRMGWKPNRDCRAELFYDKYGEFSRRSRNRMFANR